MGSTNILCERCGQVAHCHSSHGHDSRRSNLDVDVYRAVYQQACALDHRALPLGRHCWVTVLATLDRDVRRQGVYISLRGAIVRAFTLLALVPQRSLMLASSNTALGTPRLGKARRSAKACPISLVRCDAQQLRPDRLHDDFRCPTRAVRCVCLSQNIHEHGGPAMCSCVMGSVHGQVDLGCLYHRPAGSSSELL